MVSLPDESSSEVRYWYLTEATALGRILLVCKDELTVEVVRLDIVASLVEGLA